MTTINNIAFALNSAFPFESALGFDNVGLLVGDRSAVVEKILVCLDVTSAVIDEAIQQGANLIVSHHPVIFHEMKSVTTDTYTGKIVLKCIANGISVISMHTNLDRAAGGNNTALASILGGYSTIELEDGFAREFDLQNEMPLENFVSLVKEKLNDTTVRSIGSGVVKKVITAAGAGISESLIKRAKMLSAVIVTADVKHNYAQMIRDEGVMLVENTHFASEWCVTDILKRFLEECFDGITVKVSQENINPYNE